MATEAELLRAGYGSHPGYRRMRAWVARGAKHGPAISREAQGAALVAGIPRYSAGMPVREVRTAWGEGIRFNRAGQPTGTNPMFLAYGAAYDKQKAILERYLASASITSTPTVATPVQPVRVLPSRTGGVNRIITVGETTQRPARREISKREAIFLLVGLLIVAGIVVVAKRGK